MKSLIIGYGSIGRRHSDVLDELGCDIAVLSARKDIRLQKLYRSVEEAIVEFAPDYIVIANETAKHFDTLNLVLDLSFNGTILVEKPLFKNVEKLQSANQPIFVGYNLRYHPLLQKLHAELMNQKVLSANIYAGQYLPAWRPSADYSKSYSASAALGGGVIRDLSHELDYINWLFGPWKRIAARSGKYSSLKIEAEDCCSAIIEAEKCDHITLEINYLDRIFQRNLTVHTEDHTYKLDFIHGTYQMDQHIETLKTGRNDTYRLQHLDLLQKTYEHACTLHEGLLVMQMIEAIEKSNEERRWIEYV